MRVAQVAGVAGAIVTLTETGRLCAYYLGTDPPTNVVGGEGKELNYEEMDDEHRRLLGIIRQVRFNQ
jgi:Bardet-Biedl syndrome 9 protein